MRLDKLLEENKIGSRKSVKRRLLTGEVMVNDEIIRCGHYNVDPGLDRIYVGLQQLSGDPHRYIILNKPQGVVTAVSDAEHQTVLDSVKAQGIEVTGLFPVGRLDRDTEGLTLLTDNGQLAYELAMGDKKVTKIYRVQVNTSLTKIDQEAFLEGVKFHDGTTCKPAILKIISSSKEVSEAHVEIQEGKFHQVKKMFLTRGGKVTFLKRIALGPLNLPDDLLVGEARPLTINELETLRPFFNSEPI